MIDKKFKLFDHRFVSKHLIYIHIKNHNLKLFILGIHLPISDPKKLKESKGIFEPALTLVLTLAQEFKFNITAMLIGDFSADLNRSNRFDKIFKKNY